LREKGQPSLIVLRVLTALCLLLTALVWGSSSYESEPNNTPAEANSISGATTVLGTMNENDQDGFMWTVSDEDAQKRWIFELQGIPGRLTVAEIVRIEFADNGIDVGSTEKLTTMGTRDGYTPAITRELVFEPGEYLIGIAYAGGGSSPQSGGGAMFRPPVGGISFGEGGEPETTEDVPAPSEPEAGAYRFIIRESRPIHLQPQPPGTTRETARAVRAGSGYYTFETRESAWYTFEFQPEETNQRWDIRVQVPVGRTLDATLFDASGQQVDKRRNGDRGHLEFPDIVPGEQPYALQLEPLEPGFIVAIDTEKTGQRVEGEEAEPNGQWDLANRIDLSQPLKATINEASDADFFTFSIDEEEEQMLQALTIDTQPSGTQLSFCLHDAENVVLQCRNATTPIVLPDLLLSAGEYGVGVTRSQAEVPYTISFGEQGPVEPGIEVEPNDKVEIATRVPANLRIKGRAGGDDTDFYEFLITGELQLWRFQVIGENIREIAIHDSGGNETSNLRPQAGQRRMRFDDIFLLPGRHYVRITADDGAEYALLARALGPPDPNGEREPNDDKSTMQRLAIGQTRTGLLSDANDTDFYRFFLANWDHVSLTVEPPPDGIVAPHLYWYDSSFAQGIPQEPGEIMNFAGVLPPGDYHLQLTTGQPSDAEYKLSLERLPRWSCVSDCEPSGLNTYYGASPLPWNFVLEGASDEWRDSDSYQLPTLSEPSALTIRSADPVRSLFLGRHHHDAERLQYDQESGAYQTAVPADIPMRLIVESGREPYHLELEFENGPKPLADPRLSAEIQLALDTETVSAFRVYGQVVNGRLILDNSGSAPLTAQIETVTSDYRWQVALERPYVTLAQVNSSPWPE
jgi:hypothetical protein